MSKIFYDHLIILEKVEVLIKDSTQHPEERVELWGIVDEIIHHKMLHIILTHLPEEHHRDFLDKYHSSPHDEALIDYLNSLIEHDVEELIRREVSALEEELLSLVGEKDDIDPME